MPTALWVLSARMAPTRTASSVDEAVRQPGAPHGGRLHLAGGSGGRSRCPCRAVTTSAHGGQPGGGQRGHAARAGDAQDARGDLGPVHVGHVRVVGPDGGAGAALLQAAPVLAQGPVRGLAVEQGAPLGAEVRDGPRQAGFRPRGGGGSGDGGLGHRGARRLGAALRPRRRPPPPPHLLGLSAPRGRPLPARGAALGRPSWARPRVRLAVQGVRRRFLLGRARRPPPGSSARALGLGRARRPVATRASRAALATASALRSLASSSSSSSGSPPCSPLVPPAPAGAPPPPPLRRAVPAAAPPPPAGRRSPAALPPAPLAPPRRAPPRRPLPPVAPSSSPLPPPSAGGVPRS